MLLKKPANDLRMKDRWTSSENARDIVSHYAGWLCRVFDGEFLSVVQAQRLFNGVHASEYDSRGAVPPLRTYQSIPQYVVHHVR